ncbi:hypothetical protein IGI04_038620 [Brassica rapa subsp. trilocularis]|uniref:Uncharacterized protein n=1 Tax=Brassica rapa subsp. trilocularis TaxID=1813537 RepID=A0ABQ7LKS6_BRACM|nr:hypothetical protein IGI04_038620 [Brassica rapa subsp. trilocularis]
MDALEKKLFAAQGSQLRLYEQYMSSVSRLKEKDQVIDLVRSEASINAQALKKLVEEEQILRERAREAACRVQEKNQELRHVCSVIKKHESLVDSVLATIVSEDETKLSKWDQKPSMQKAASLVSLVTEMHNERKFLTFKLDRAEQEVERVREQNRELKKELRRSHLTSKKRKEKVA